MPVKWLKGMGKIHWDQMMKKYKQSRILYRLNELHIQVSPATNQYWKPTNLSQVLRWNKYK